MSKFSYLILLLFCLTACHNEKPSAAQTKATDSIAPAAEEKEPVFKDTAIVYDWNKDGQLDSFILKNYTADPKFKRWDYKGFIIKLSGQKALDFSDTDEDDPIVTEKLSFGYVDSVIPKINLLHTDALALFRNGESAESPVLLFACDAGPTFIGYYIFSIGANGAPHKILSTEGFMFKFKKYDDLPGYRILVDSSQDVSLSGFSYDQTVNGDAGEGIMLIRNKNGGFVKLYKPVSVFAYKPDTFMIDTARSIQETRKNNNGIWAGFSSRIDSVVYKRRKM
jgi:hypothetical protein